MKSYHNLARAISYCWDIICWERNDRDYRKADNHAKTVSKLLEIAKSRDTTPTCASCRHWFHKSSTEKHWGRCTNEKVHESTYITFRDIPEGISPQTMMAATEDCEIRTEENSFGCIHHEPM